LNQHLIPFFKNKPLSGIHTFDVERYKKARLETGAAPGTINRELAALSHLLNKALEWRWLDSKPAIIKRLKENLGRITYLTSEQAANLIRESQKDQNPHIYPFIVIGLGTGMRRMEILSIRLKDIALEHKTIHIRNSKTGARSQPMTKELTEFLWGYMEAAEPGQEWLFPSIGSRTGHVVAIEKAFKRVVTNAGMDPAQVVRHTLRHTAGSGRGGLAHRETDFRS